MTEVTTLSPEVIAAIAAAVQAAKPAKKAKGEKKARAPLTEDQKAERRAKVDEVTVTNFLAKGYKDIKPRVNVMTYNKWIENGRRVNRGEKATICGSFPLFHIKQTSAIMADGKMEQHAKSALETNPNLN